MKHITIDCYGSNQHQLDDMKVINQVLSDVTYELNLDPICPPVIIPYYYGKVKDDKGISAFVLLEGGHITIHTFPIRKCYFVDVFFVGDFNEYDCYRFFLEQLPFNENKSIVNKRERLERKFEMAPYEPSVDFGPHIMMEIEAKNEIKMDNLFDFLENMAYEIDMDPITRPFIIKSTINNPLYLSGIIVIAQSHISVHYSYKTKIIYADLFSCAPFDYSVVEGYLTKLGKIVSSQLVARGTKHLYRINTSDDISLMASSKWQKVIKNAN